MSNTVQKGLKIAAFATIGLLIIKNANQRTNSKPAIKIAKALPGNYNALTLPPFGIYITEKEKGNLLLLQHELKHWQQYQKLGLLKYYNTYYQQYVKYGYDKMPMEIEARVGETEYAKSHYTKAVRSGKANTIYNPEFRKGKNN
ncbi:MAG: hypothetical protein PHE56_08875 [Bacteroidales bacterium]|jgi:hypothetical protein|nr:hypothetical protein [Bacteroidales bacterium]